MNSAQAEVTKFKRGGFKQQLQAISGGALLCATLFLHAGQTRAAETPETPKIPETPETTETTADRPLFESVLTWTRETLIDPVQGVTIYRSEGEGEIQAREEPSGPSYAEGKAPLDSWGVQLYLRPSAGWQIGPRLGFLSLESELSDFSEAINDNGTSTDLEGELLSSQCRWLDDPTPQPCESPNRYQLKIWSFYGGISGGYAWLTQPFKASLISTYIGFSWIPLSLQYTRVQFGESVRDERFSFELFNGLTFDLSFALEIAKRVALSLDLSMGALGVARHKPSLEVRGRRYCDTLGCTRERSFLRESSISALLVGVGLSFLWGSESTIEEPGQ